MKALLLSITILLISSCTIYRPVAMGTGKYSGKHVEDCAKHILTMTFAPESSRVDYVLNKYGIDHSDVYSIEAEHFHFLFPLFATSCTVISLNKKGVEAYMKRRKNGSHKAALPSSEKFLQ